MSTTPPIPATSPTDADASEVQELASEPPAEAAAAEASVEPAAEGGATAAAATTATTSGTTTTKTTTTATKKATKKATTKTTKSKKATIVKATGAGTQAKAKKPSAPRTTKKKPATSKVGNNPATQAILQDARAAASDLAQQRAHAAARKADPLWYRIEDVVPAVLSREGDQVLSSSLKKMALPSKLADGSDGDTLTPSMEEYIAILERALAHNGMSRSDVTPQAMACLLEYARRFTSEMIRSAQDYMVYAGRTQVSREDLNLVRQENPISIYTQLPMIGALAQQINRKPLPPIPSNCYSGILLPPPEHQLTARTFDVISSAVTALRTQSKYPTPLVAPTGGGVAAASSVNSPSVDAKSGTVSSGGGSAAKPLKSKNKDQPSYGASRGRQIAVKLRGESSSAKKQQEATAAAAALGDSTSTKVGGYFKMEE